ncbi:uncharacterized protein MELLADRAFT_92172 [Melampsora larici-populina 98AG31]|uniref:Major facilitator superfamily (MFS) profile domain-containing protein n=1 Tax=Melampsora larici-populina (strain 98AG31 / pathotype 3-4-7) TaxID=747676 RepID=F4S1R9_MELLP|nr:uncharacterized protein MELLADRAFT_92172 [Melampsora larici-populina 98AG31]EGG01458.1 hypothetical protein MELLADRAFT_92172 [Melampsora larici-populina 98AG31]
MLLHSCDRDRCFADQESPTDPKVLPDAQQDSENGLKEQNSGSSFRNGDSDVLESNANGGRVKIRWGAWGYLAGMFILETTIWVGLLILTAGCKKANDGFPSSYGVLLDYYLHTRFADESSANFILPLVGTVNTGLLALLIPIVSAVLNRFPHIKPQTMYFGVGFTTIKIIRKQNLALLSVYGGKLIIFVLLIIQSVHVLLTLGIGYGIGGVAIYYPALTYLPEWFPERPGLANGIVFSGLSIVPWFLRDGRFHKSNSDQRLIRGTSIFLGNGVGGLLFPFIIERLLAKCGITMALAYLTIIITVAVLVSLYLVKPPYPSSRIDRNNDEDIWQTIGDWHALKAGALWLFVAANIFQTFSYFLPSLYLPRLSPTSGTTLLAALNIANIGSRLVFGTLSDHFSTHLIGGATSLVAAISIVFLWGAETFSMNDLIIFSIIFGGTSGSWTSLYFSVIKEWRVDERTTLSIYSIFSATRGIANILSGPISSSLLRKSNLTAPRSGFSSPYSGVIAFCGANMLLTAAIEAVLFASQFKAKRIEKFNTLASHQDTLN